MPTQTTCIICKNERARLGDARETSLNRRVTCPVCGEYDTESYAVIDHPFPIVFSGVIRNYCEMYKAPLDVPININTTIDDIKPHIPHAIPGDTDVPAKADLILKWLRMKTHFPGHKVALDPDLDWPIGFCRNSTELEYILDYLQGQGHINVDPPASFAEPSELCQITPIGWAYLSGIGYEAKDQCFIAMAFRLPTSDVLHTDGLNPGIMHAGYNPMRIDRKDHNNRIDDEIVAEIRKSKFVVADLTDKNAGAYFEAGFAMGLGKPVIWTCQQSEIDAGNVHFDTRQYSIVSWEPDKLDDFAERLTQRIEATIGRGKQVPELATKEKRS